MGTEKPRGRIKGKTQGPFKEEGESGLGWQSLVELRIVRTVGTRGPIKATVGSALTFEAPAIKACCPGFSDPHTQPRPLP